MASAAACGAGVLGPSAAVAESGESPWTFSGYVEPYVVVERRRSPEGQRAGFLYNFDRAGQPDLNLAMVRVGHEGPRLRAGLAVAAGTYMEANYAAEPSGLGHLLEGWIGTASSDGRVTADIGVFPSHIGFESAIGVDNWTLTRSLAAENSPYFESGLRVGWRSKDGRWSAAGLLLNGWQRIRRPDSLEPAIGHQLTWTPHDRLTVNSSSFIGSDKPRGERRMRYFHDLYAIASVGEAWQVAAGLDTGFEEATAGGGRVNRWSSPQLVVRRRLGSTSFAAARVERYRDPGGVLVSPTGDGLVAWGLSANVDRRFGKRYTLRTEVRWLRATAPVFETRSDGPRRDDVALTVSVGIDAGARLR
jgi:hypothetical protein